MSTSNTLDSQEAAMATLDGLFSEAGLGKPEVYGAAPGRVNVIGEHIDYNGGMVLPAAIDRWINVALRRRDDDRVRLVSAQSPGKELSFSISGDLEPKARCWGNYAKGVIAGLKEKGYDVPGFDAAVTSTVPVGGGLSSSAALEAVFGKTLLTAMGASMDDLELAKLCQKAEHKYAGVPCGLMDQAAVILCREGKLLKLDCLDDSFEYAPFEDPDWTLLIMNSCVSHELSDGGYAVRRDGCHAAARILNVDTLRELDPRKLDEYLANPQLTEEMQRYLRHVVTEIDRTRKTVAALSEGDYWAAGRFLNESHVSLRDDYRVSCPELDFITALAQEQDGVAGCRLTGAGFGGSAIALARADVVGGVVELVSKRYKEAFGIDAKIFETRPMGGARSWLAE